MRDREALGQCGSSLRMGLRKINSCYHSFTLGTGLTLVCQGPPAIALLLNPNVGDFAKHNNCCYAGRTGLSPPAVYPFHTVELRANKDNLWPRHYIYTVDYYSRVDQGYAIFIRGPPLEHPLLERTMIPQMNENKRIT